MNRLLNFRRICRVCATEILLWGIRDWWVRERAKGFLEEHILARKDCPAGNACENQKDMGTSKLILYTIYSYIDHHLQLTRRSSTTSSPSEQRTLRDLAAKANHPQPAQAVRR